MIRKLALLASIILVSSGSIAIGPGALPPTGSAAMSSGDERSSPSDCLDALRSAYEQRDIAAYEVIFHRDFVFVFDPQDVSQYQLPETWSRVEEMECAANMFDDARVESVQLDFLQGPAIPSTEYPGTWKVEVTEVELQVTIHPPEQEPHVISVSGGGGTFYLKPGTAADARGSRPSWTTWRWEDHRPDSGSEETSWGCVKALFR